MKTLGIVILALLVFLAIYIYIDSQKNRKDQISDYLVEIPIGAYSFEFPRNVIRSQHPQKENPRQTLVSLRFLLPHFEPKTLENADQFSPFNTLTVNISGMHFNPNDEREQFSKIDTSFNYDLAYRIENAFSALYGGKKFSTYPPLEEGEDFGELMLFHNGKSQNIKNEIFIDKSQPTKLMVECVGENKLPNPNCRFDADTLGHLNLHYRYPKKFINNASQIHAFVFSFLQSHFKGVTYND